jgi:hypothetical protein
MDELYKLSKELIGKPVLLEHDKNIVVGSITLAYNIEDKLFVIFRLHKNTYGGHLTNILIQENYMKGVSLGHIAKVDYDKYGIGSVSNKRPIEVSIVIDGALGKDARIISSCEEEANIYINKSETTSYNCMKMSDNNIDINNKEVSTTTNMETLLENMNTLKRKNQQMEDELRKKNKLIEDNRNMIKSEIKGTLEAEAVQDLVSYVIDNFPEMKKKEQLIKSNFENMKCAVQAKDMAQFIGCCASLRKKNAVELNEILQKNNVLQKKVKDLTDNKNPYLMESDQRFVSVNASMNNNQTSGVDAKESILPPGVGAADSKENMWDFLTS